MFHYFKPFVKPCLRRKKPNNQINKVLMKGGEPRELSDPHAENADRPARRDLSDLPETRATVA